MKKNTSRPQAGPAAPVRRTASKSSDLRSQGSIVSPPYSLESTHCINIFDTALLISGSSVVIDWPVSVVAFCCTEHQVTPGFHERASCAFFASPPKYQISIQYLCLSVLVQIRVIDCIMYLHQGCNLSLYIAQSINTSAVPSLALGHLCVSREHACRPAASPQDGPLCQAFCWSQRHMYSAAITTEWSSSRCRPEQLPSTLHCHFHLTLRHCWPCESSGILVLMLMPLRFSLYFLIAAHRDRHPLLQSCSATSLFWHRIAHRPTAQQSGSLEHMHKIVP